MYYPGQGQGGHHHHHHHHHSGEYQQGYQQPYPQQQYNQYPTQPIPVATNMGYGQPQVFYNCTIRSYTNPHHYLFVSNDGVKGFGQDFDIRTHTHVEERNKFIIEHFGNGLCIIKHQLTGQFLFVANDGSRGYGSDYDVRSHPYAEERNKVNVLRTQTPGVWAIQSTACNQYIFCSNDGVNGYGSDFDVRSHPHIEDRNMWFIDGFNY
ncbi:hypothetical protein ABPG74_001883 [Tetrahymena malaccensis]